MTINQTIDGVPREKIERALDAIEQVGLQDKFIDYTFVRTVKQELRALLDKTEADIPASTPQGEPVAYLDGNGKFVFIGYEKLRTACWVDGSDRAIPDAWKPLYAEQPAPVAVVLPERRAQDGWQSLTSQDLGWNACLDEVTRLNTK